MADQRPGQFSDPALEINQQPPPMEIRHADGRIEHPRVRREVRDVGFWPILAFVVISVLVGGAQLVLVWCLFRAGEGLAEQAEATRHPLASKATVLPREPRLEQINRSRGLEQGNVREIELRDLARLDHFGTTKEKGFIHIPIQDAMDLVVSRLPVEPVEDDYRSRGLVDAGESNSGRMFRGEQR